MRWWTELKDILRGELTLRDLAAPSGWRRRFQLAGLWLREAAAAARRADLATLASALTYKTLLSLVPVAAVALAILSTVNGGAYTDQFVDYLRHQLPLPEETVDNLVEMVRALAGKAWAVAGGGAVFFVWTVVTLFTTIESAFGRVWRVARGRAWRRRLPAYVTTMVMVPPFIALSAWVGARLSAWSSEVGGAPWFGRLAMTGFAWALMVAGMTAFYYLLPATKVRLAAAGWGGLAAGTLLEGAKWAFRTYGRWTFANYENIYGTLLALPLLLLWLWLVWTIVLGGAELAFVAQHFKHLMQVRDLARAGEAWKPAAAAWALRIAAETWRDGADPSNMDEKLAERAGLSSYYARSILEELADAGVLRRVADLDDAYVPRAEAERMSLADAVLAVRDAPLSPPGNEPGDPFNRWLAERFAAAAAAERAVLSEPDWRAVLAGFPAASAENGGDDAPDDAAR